MDIKKGQVVFFIPDNRYYTVEDVELDVAYLIDSDGSSFTATENEIDFNRTFIKEPIDLAFIEALLIAINEAGADFVEYEGVLNDNYIIYGVGDVHIDEEEPTDYIILLAEFATSWSNDLYMIRTNDYKVVQYYEELFEEN